MFYYSAFISAEFGLSIQRTAAISFFNAVLNSSKTNNWIISKEKIGFNSIVSICPAEDWISSYRLGCFLKGDLKLLMKKELRCGC